MTFQKELEQLLNKHSKDNECNTPDFILAEYLSDCLNAFNKANRLTAQWKSPDYCNRSKTLEQQVVGRPPFPHGEYYRDASSDDRSPSAQR